MRLKYAVLILTGSLLAGCAGSGGTLNPNSTNAANLHVSNLQAAIARQCGGTNGVSVTPCPVRFTKAHHASVETFVKGPGRIVTSLVLFSNCFVNGQQYCILKQVGPLEWVVKPGSACGAANAVFGAYDGPFLTGYGYLKILNSWCP